MLKCSLVFSLILITLLTACATSQPSALEQSDVCDIFDNRKNWYRATAKTEKEWGTPIAVQMAIIKAESNFRRDARPARGKRRNLGLTRGKRPSTARGFAQALNSTWDEYKLKTRNPNASRENFMDASDFVGWYTAQSSRIAGIRLGDARAQYLAYHEGAGGFSRGTWRSKQWLINVADRVARDAATFDRQLDGCKGRLKRRGLFG